jgi:V8-like Glu-specific endopeptidase
MMLMRPGADLRRGTAPAGRPSAGAALRSVFATTLATLLLAAPAAGSEAVAGKVVDPEAAERYWTPERMRAAEPVARELGERPGASSAAGVAASSNATPTYVEPIAPGAAAVPSMERGIAGEAEASARSEVKDPSEAEFRTHGKVFFTVAGGKGPGKYSCSGTAVASPNRSLVWTAGHCVYDDRGGGWVRNLVFVPAYRNGEAPFGKWPARKRGTTAAWRSSFTFRQDFGVAVVGRNGEGKRLTEVVGGQGIGFAQPRNQSYSAFGYPVSPVDESTELPIFPEFDGRTMHRCDSPLGGTDNPPGKGPPAMWINCDMTWGASGGSWVADGRVLSVSSYKYGNEPDRMYGPYQEKAARKLYRGFAGKVPHCQGKPVTLLGTRGDDRLIGTPGRDVIKALRGDDVIRGRGGNDVICAGPGDDRVKGGRGRDRIDGGPGFDRCDGGPGRDRAKRCEITRRVG